MIPRWLRGWSLAAAAVLAWAGSAAACPFCMEQRGPTLIGDFNQASMVLFGKFTNPKLDPEGDLGGGTTDFVIETVLKKHSVLGDRKTITLPRYVPNSKSKFLLFCDVYKGKIDPYRGVQVEGSGDMVKYLKGAMAIKDKSIGGRLRYCFDYLDSPEMEISLDAYREFAVASYQDYRDMARKLPPDRIAGWLKDPKTPPYRFGLYASLLGHCGTTKHARLLRSILDDKERRAGSGIDGLLAAYILLEPKEGWAYLRDLVSNPKNDFQLRYAGLRTIRFFWDTRPDVVKKEDRLAALCLLLDQSDIADFAVEDLRKWQCWNVGNKVLGLTRKEAGNLPVIRRAVLRYAFASVQANKNVPLASEFIKAERKRDKEYADDIEEMLKLETEAPPKK